MFVEGTWRHEATGLWLESFLKGGSDLRLTWSDGRLERAED